MIRNTCGKFQSNTSSGYLENKPLHANLNVGCDGDADADAGGSTIALLIYKYIVELKTIHAELLSLGYAHLLKVFYLLMKFQVNRSGGFKVLTKTASDQPTDRPMSQ